MTVSLKHKFTSAKSDGVDTTLVRPSNWNDDHDLTLAASKLLGRATASTGAAEEITVGTSLSLDAATQTIRRAALTGDVTASVDSNATTIAAGAATLAKLDRTGSTGQVLTAQGSGVAPIWAAAAGAPTPDVQTFLSSGTWTKPTGSYNWVRIQIWGGGGSGGKGSSSNAAAGGGGGSYAEATLPYADVSTSSITIGAGGVAQTTAGTDGNVGGTTSFGTLLSAYGGGGGSRNNDGGDGGGPLGAGGIADNTYNASRTSGGGGIGGISGGLVNGGAPYNPWAGAGGGAAVGDGISNGAKGGNAFWGGAGGGGATEDSSPAPGVGGTSLFGGNGGAGAFDTGVATSGSVPAGGGGGSEVGNSGAGGAGKAIVTTY